MDRLAGFLERRRWVVLGAWILVLVGALSFAARQTDHLTSGGFEVPGSQSQVVSENVQRFDGAQRDNLAVVLARRPAADAAAVRAEVDRVGSIAARLPHVELTPEAAAQAKRQADSASITVVALSVEGDRDQIADMAVDFRDELGTAAHGGVEPHLVGQQALWAGMQDLTKEDLASAERIGFPVVLIILLAVFGSLAAAALPLALGFASVTITGAIIFFLSQATPMSVFVTNIASMIGIGVAVDYSLFVLARYREEIRGGRGRTEARRIALRTSGLAVTFSGVTVMLSLAGLYLVHSTTIRSMAMGAIIVVAISILAAVTLLPVLMSVLGRRAYAAGGSRSCSACWWGPFGRAGAAPGPRAPRRAAASGSAGRTASPRIRGPVRWGPQPCCSRSPSRRSRSRSGTARCASSRRTTRRAWAPSSRRGQPGRARPVPSRRSRSWTRDA